jgi:hypothetical protein
MARPEKIIDWELVDEKIIHGCPGTEIAAYFGMHPNTFYLKVEEQYKTSFSDYWQQKHMEGNTCIRKWQWEKAKTGDNTMLIWLGKNRLKQSESPQELNVGVETLTNFNAIMSQLSSLQSSARKSADINNNNE